MKDLDERVVNLEIAMRSIITETGCARDKSDNIPLYNGAWEQALRDVIREEIRYDRFQRRSWLRRILDRMNEE